MATWQNAVVTQRGLNLQAKMEAGSTLLLTKAVSSTNYVNPTTLDRMTDIHNQKQTLTMNDVVPVDVGKAIFGVILTNINLTESYVLNQIGVFAQDPDLGEILYFVAQAEEPDTIPSAAALPDFSITYSFNMIIANAGVISAVIDPLALATKDDILALRAKDALHDISLSAINIDITALQAKDAQHDTELSNKANANSPALTGTPIAPTAAQTVNNAQIATTAFVKTGLAGKEDKVRPTRYGFAYGDKYESYGNNHDGYFKHAGVCYMVMNAEVKSGNKVSVGDLVATMPVGFRLLNGGADIPCVFGGSSTGIGSLMIRSDGSLRVTRADASVTYTSICVAAAYPADQY